MKHPTSRLLAAAAAVALSGYALSGPATAGHAARDAGMPQGKYRQRAHDGPYRVVLSKPITGLGYEAGSLYREHEYLGAMFNQLARDGLEPVFTEVMTQRTQGLLDEDRLLVVCRKK